MTDPIRLSKALAAQLACSRREAELYIEGGWVTVDGEVIEEPQHKVAGEVLALLPGAEPKEAPPVTLLLNKPAGFDAGAGEQSAAELMLPEHHWTDDPSRIRTLKRHFLRHKITLPLEREDCGLMVYTQDWRTARKLIEDGYLLEQEYVVEVAGTLTPEQLALLNHGLSFEGRALPPIKVSWQNETRLRFALKAPRPGQIRHMCESQGLQVVSLKRIRIGRMPMAALPPGQWRYVAGYERF